MEDGTLFWGVEARVQSSPQRTERRYAVLFRFSSDGRFFSARHSSSSDSEFRAENVVEGFVSELGSVEFGDIAVSPFETIIDGVRFGLVFYPEFESVTLEPNSIISFQAPWDGEYFT